MPVNSIHPEVTEHITEWERCYDAYLGNDKIKSEGVTYLPLLTTNQGETEYNSYLARGNWYGATGRTVQGLIGAALHIEPTIELTGKLEKLVNAQMCRSVVRELITQSRAGALVDLGKTPGSIPAITIFQAPNIINYEFDEDGKLIFVMLKESVKGSTSEDDPYEVGSIEQWRECYLDDGTYGMGTPERRVYRQVVWRYGIGTDQKAAWVEHENFEPVRAGESLDFIPFILFNHEQEGAEVLPPIIADLVATNLTHYRVTADYMHGLHWTALPTPWISGVSNDDVIMPIGSGIAWKIPDPAGRAGYLEFTGQGLQAVVDALDKLELQMAMLGARLFETKAAVESAETTRLRQSAEVAVLSTIIGTTEQVLRKCITWAAWWGGMDNFDSEKAFSMSRDFISQKLTPQEVTALVAAVQAGKISNQTFIECLVKGEIIATDAEEEMGRIDKQGPDIAAGAGSMDLGAGV